MFNKPVCKICKGKHWLNEGHIWSEPVNTEEQSVSIPVSIPKSSNNADVSIPVKPVSIPATKQQRYRLTHKKAYNAYMKAYMARQRTNYIPVGAVCV